MVTLESVILFKWVNHQNALFDRFQSWILLQTCRHRWLLLALPCNRILIVGTVINKICSSLPYILFARKFITNSESGSQGALSIQQKFPFKISEIPPAEWNGTFWLHRPNPSHQAFGYCSCKRDTKEGLWGQQFCQMEQDN